LNRVVAIIAGTLILLAVGFFLGRRPVGHLNAQVKQLTEMQEKQTAQLREQAALAEAKGYLWQARARLLIASRDVEDKNFGKAGDQVAEAQKLLTRAAAVESLHIDVSAVQDLVGAAAEAVTALDAGAVDALVRASQLLGSILEQERA